MIHRELALERVLAEGNEWQSWRALRLSGEDPGPPPSIPDQDHLGGFLGPAGAPSAGATGEALCHLLVLGLGSSGPAAVAADWWEMVSPFVAARSALIIGRGIGYLGFGALGGWAAQQLERSLEKLDLYDQVDDQTGRQFQLGQIALVAPARGHGIRALRGGCRTARRPPCSITCAVSAIAAPSSAPAA